MLLWFTDNDERKTQREELIRDALWVEQAMQFQFTSERDRLERFAADLVKGDLQAEQFASQARQLVTINRELVDIVWLTRRGKSSPRCRRTPRCPSHRCAPCCRPRTHC